MDQPLVLTILGSGTLAPDGSRASAAHHLRVGEASLLLDCGSGALHALDAYGIDWPRLTHVCLTHFHYDHVADLPAVLIALKHGPTGAPREAPLTLVGPRGVGRVLRGWSEALGTAFLEQAFDVVVVELDPGQGLEPEGGAFSLACHPTPHTDDSIAYRIATPVGDVGYTGDTGPSDAVAGFLSGVRVLVAECTHGGPVPQERHLTPETLARLADIAAPEILVVTHVAPPLSPAEAVARVARRWGGRVVEGVDGLVVRIDPDGVAVDLPGRGG